MPLSTHLTARLDATIDTLTALREHMDAVTAVAGELLSALDSRNTIYTCGNGGSAAQAMHLAEELIGRYRSDRPAQRAVCLNADPTTLTCIANDYGYESIFARQCEALLSEGDILIVLTTSGRSANIVKALEVAAGRNATTIGLLGGTGGVCVERCDHSIVVPADDSAHVQDAHQVLIHLLCEAVELHTSRS